MKQRTRLNALTLMLLLVVMQVPAAPPRPHPAKMTGVQIVRDMFADPFVGDVNFVRRERAMGYIDGVMDLSTGVSWCPAGKSVPHELNYLVAEELSSMPAVQLNGNAAALVRSALARLYPCRSTGATQ